MAQRSDLGHMATLAARDIWKVKTKLPDSMVGAANR